MRSTARAVGLFCALGVLLLVVAAGGAQGADAAGVTTAAGATTAADATTAAGATAALASSSPAFSLSGALHAPGGPFLYDRFNRVVFLHGVNIVYKRPPFEVYPDRGKPWNFGPGQARRIRRLGFNVVRLGIIWQGLEPGTLPPNDPRVCANGKPGDPRQLRRAILVRYLDRVRETIDLLARQHIYTLLDMHQDVYGRVLGGEGAPRWAVCTDGVRPTRPPGRWSKIYGTAAADIAFSHFWKNNVVGNLQGQFDQVWGMVAHFFRNDPWVIGFDPYNEPFSASIRRMGDEHFDAELECFYTGSAHVGRLLHGAPPIHCPRDDPRTGVVPILLRNAPGKLVFVEPDIFARGPAPTFLGPMDFSNLVFNIHVYCGYRNPVTGNPTNASACLHEEARALALRREDRGEMASRAQRSGPAWFVSEFGATSNATYLTHVVALMDARLVGWTYWSWKYYDDPTGSTDEALVTITGRLRPTARVLAQTYAEAVAGIPTSMRFDASTTTFVLRYRAPHHRLGRSTASAPTLVVVPTAVRYPHGYCVKVSGGRDLSPIDSALLAISSRPHARSVTVVVTAAHATKVTHGRRTPVCPA